MLIATSPPVRLGVPDDQAPLHFGRADGKRAKDPDTGPAPFAARYLFVSGKREWPETGMPSKPAVSARSWTVRLIARGPIRSAGAATPARRAVRAARTYLPKGGFVVEGSILKCFQARDSHKIPGLIW